MPKNKSYTIKELLDTDGIVVKLSEEEILELPLEKVMVLIAEGEVSAESTIDRIPDNLIVLGLHLDLILNEVEELNIEGEGCNTYIVDGEEYFTGNDVDTNELVESYIEDSLWAFNDSFLSSYGVLDYMNYNDVITILTPLREGCESSNDAVKALVDWDENKDEIVLDAISEDSVGHLLNSYDGTSVEVSYDDVLYTICRIN